MLNRDEEYRVAACIDVVTRDLTPRHGIIRGEGLGLMTQLWLAEKLKEVNDELSQVWLELENANRQWADCEDRC